MKSIALKLLWLPTAHGTHPIRGGMLGLDGDEQSTCSAAADGGRILAVYRRMGCIFRGYSS